MVEQWIMDRIRDIFWALDSVIYGFITKLYELLLYLANLNLFGSQDGDMGLQDFTNRIYVLLGIFMLFKVSFSILRYLVSPDEFSDRSKGMGKLVTNVLVVLVLLVLTPTIFEKAFELQGVILKDNVISKLVFGNSTGGDIKDISNTNSILAEDMEFLVFGAFFTTNPDISDFSSCGGAQVLGTVSMATAGSGECVKKVEEVISNKGHSEIGYFFRTDEKNERSFPEFANIINLAKNDKYYFNYSFGFSTITGIFIVIMLLSYCIAVAVRAVKLYFLQIIAPIPIVSYIDPAQGKDGAMMKWAKECGKTYASLFIRLAIIFLAFYLIDLISQTVLANNVTYYNTDNPEGVMNALVTLLLIIGTLIFANQAPKLIENIFGINFTGEFTVNPLKQIKESPLASAAIAGTASLAAAGTLGGITAFNTSRGMGRGVGRSIMSGIGGIVSGGVRGAKAGIQGKDKGFGLPSAFGSLGSMTESMKLRKDGGGVFKRMGSSIAELTNAPYEADQYEERMETRGEYIKYQKNAKERAEFLFDTSEDGKKAKAKLTAAENSGNDAEITAAQEAYETAKKDAVKNEIENGSDAIIRSQLEAMERVARENPTIGLSSILVSGKYNWDAACNGKKAAERDNMIEESSDGYENAKKAKKIRQAQAKNSWFRNQNK